MAQLAILVVEPDEVLRETLAYNLQGDDYFILTALDGVQALEMARHNPISVVILELALPRLSGLEVCRLLRQSPTTATVPILILTARDDETEKIVALEMGADDFILKPFRWVELRARIRALLRRSGLRSERERGETGAGRADRERIIAVDGLTIDVDRRLVVRDGEHIEMKPRLFDLLVYMARYRGIALTRDRLLEHVWGYAYNGDIRTIDVHVRWLREKIEVNPNDPHLIQTIRGVGYRLRDVG
ncbi:MAG TPA: response regulator transcription factor [Ktedonobacterales bacterium]|nr:response regulator transcription factor [Ktedonobacterales bacterium]